MAEPATHHEHIIPFRYGSGGHYYKEIIDGEHHSQRRDRRVKQENKHRRSKIRKSDGSRNTIHGIFQKGTKHTKYMLCTKCNEVKKYKHFTNHSILEADRFHNGHNIRCRACQDRQYENGYLIDDFVVPDIEEDMDEDLD